MTALAGSHRGRGLESQLVDNFLLQLVKVLSRDSAFSEFFGIPWGDRYGRSGRLSFDRSRLRSALRNLQPVQRQLLEASLIVR